jgi:hypothetical protein
MLVMPLKMLMSVVAVKTFMWKTVVKLIMKFPKDLIVPSFSSASFPVNFYFYFIFIYVLRLK